MPPKRAAAGAPPLPAAGDPLGLPTPPHLSAFDNLNISATSSGGEEASDEDDEDYEEEDDDEGVQLPHAVMKRVLALKQLQDKRTDVFNEYKAARIELEAKFRPRYTELYVERKDIVNGDKEPQPVDGEQADEHPEEEENEPVKGVPQFWLQSLLRHEALADLIEENDMECLAHLTDIRCTDKDDLMGFTLEFDFSENTFFSNKTLTKSYETAAILDLGEPLIESVKGTQINWHSMKTNLCEKVIKQKPNRRGGRGRGGASSKTKKTDSFFKFFLEPHLADTDDDDEDEEEIEQPYELSYEMDYEVALVLRNHIVPNAVLWYTGEAVSDDEDDEMDEDGDEDESEGHVSGVGTSGGLLTFGAPPAASSSGTAAAGSADPENPECKQS